MLFCIHGIDAADAMPRRMEHYDGHRAHLAKAEGMGVRIVMSGPLVADDGQTPMGSLLIVEAESRAAVETYQHADPFYIAGIWEKFTITAFKKMIG